MAAQADLARGWVQKGDSDRIATMRILDSAGPYDTACFHAQQAAEKYLKAVLAWARRPIPRPHDLEDLYGLVAPVVPSLVVDRMELSTLTPYAVQLRYDIEFWPDRATAQQALAGVDRVRSAVLGVLPPEAQP